MIICCGRTLVNGTQWFDFNKWLPLDKQLRYLLSGIGIAADTSPCLDFVDSIS